MSCARGRLASSPLLGRRPAQVLVQKRERALAVDAVAALEELDVRPVGQPELRVEEPHLGIFVRHPLIAAHEVEMAALDHERARHHEISHLRVVERLPQFQYGISHSIVRMKLKGSSVAATLRVHWLKSPEQIDRQYFSRSGGTRTAVSPP